MPTPSTYFYAFAEDLIRVVLHEPSPKASGIPEALVQDLWKHRRFEVDRLRTVGGIPVTVLDPGRQNFDTGPDFIDARLRLGSTIWRGAVEIHTTSGLWMNHGHDRDPLYDSTLLHVVLYHDIWTGKLRRADGTVLPELVLYPYLGAPLRRLIHSFYLRPSRQIYCAAGWHRVPEPMRRAYLEELASERTLEKARRMAESVERGLYEALFAGLGYSKNTAPMRTLTRVVPLETSRSLGEPQDVEALYLGAAGLIPAPADLLDADRATADYAMELKDRFERINHRFEIEPMMRSSWRFFRLRPPNFPPLRIAQAAGLLHPRGGLLRSNPLPRLASASRTEKPVQALRVLLDVNVSPFWRTHVRLDRRSTSSNASIGRERIDALLVNAVIPALLAANAIRVSDALAILRALPAARDEVVRTFVELGTTPASALEAQGLHQLYRTRCREARCLSCRIGQSLLSSEK